MSIVDGYASTYINVLLINLHVLCRSYQIANFSHFEPGISITHITFRFGNLMLSLLPLGFPSLILCPNLAILPKAVKFI
jgi:hypothetical protein